MDRTEYLRLMQFPAEWENWGMIPDEWLAGAIESYEQGMEDASEHARHGAFQWWLKRRPTSDELVVLARLSLIDSDQAMAGFVREGIRRAESFSAAVEAALGST